MIYIAFLCLFIFSSLLDFKKKYNQIAINMFSGIVLKYLIAITLFFVGLRFHTGADWNGYIKYFNVVTWDNAQYQLGYKTLNMICKSICSDYFLVQFVSTCIFCMGVHKFFFKYSGYYFLSWFLAVSIYFTSLFMSQQRQALAIGILLLGSHFLFEKKYFKFIITVILASLFHITAIITIFAFLLGMKIPKSLRIGLVLLGFVLIKIPAITLIPLGLVAKFLSGKIGSMAMMYMTSARYARGASLGGGIFFFAKQFLSLIIVSLYEPKNRFDDIAINSLIFYLLIQDCSIVLMIVARLSYYIGFYAILGWLKIFEIDLIKKNKNIFLCVYMLFIVFFSSSYIKDRLSHDKSYVTGREINYAYIPYYNVFLHPSEAEYRKDWNQ